MRKSFLFGLLSFLFLILFSLAKPQYANAACDADDSACKQLEMFKQRRSGDQMNLETWYSGKADAGADDPASIGFSQIVLLDLYEKISGAGKIDWTNPGDILRKLISQDGKIDLTPLAQNSIPKSNSLSGQLGSYIGLAVSSPPVSLSSYVAGVRQNLAKHNLVKPAYAQGTGFGFQNLLPILPIWRAFRNVAYFIFVLVFILYGFMIMFRMKINPQNTASFQAAIPKIISTLLIITFAYAIAGFMIDVMFVVFNLTLSIFQASGIISDPNNPLIRIGSGQAGILSSWIFSSLVSFVFVPSAIINVLTNLPGTLSILIDIILTGFGLGLIFRIVIIIAVGYSYVKLIFKLFEAYITIIIQVIFSPIILLQDVLPGSKAFGDWLRNIVANLSVFPVTMIMLLLSYIFMIQPLLSLTGGEGFSGVHDLTTTADGLRMPLISGIGTGLGDVKSPAILSVIGFFIVLMASKYVDMVRDALKVPAFKYGTALSEALQRGWKVTGAAAGVALPARITGGVRDYLEDARLMYQRIQRVEKFIQETGPQKPLEPKR